MHFEKYENPILNSLRSRNISYMYISIWNLIPYCDPIPPSGTMLWTALNLPFVMKLSCQFPLVRPSNSWKTLILYCGLILSMGEHNLHKLESTLYQEAFMNISTFLALWFLKRVLNISPTYSHVKLWSSIVASSSPWTVIFNKLESALCKTLLYKFKLLWPRGSWKDF